VRLARSHGIVPGVTADILGIVNGLLPHASGTLDERKEWRGAECDMPITRSFLTAPTQRAARENAEWVAREEDEQYEARTPTEELHEAPSPS
jgi:hypothetical protein